MLNPGASIDVWIVDRALGQGGMGSVYQCHNREAPRIRAAVKVLHPGFQRFDSAKARFVREAELLFSLDHPGIVKVRNVRMDGETPYLEMEFVEGEELDARPHRRCLTPEVGSVFRQIADAAAHLHARGICHRDVKPSNLIIQSDGVVKLVDFGIASERAGLPITGSGPVFGSVSYVPPEWLDANHLDPVRWDIYSMGVVFWEYLNGHQAYPVMEAGTVAQEVVRVLRDKQRLPFLELGPRSPPALRALIADMTRTDWRERVITAAQVRTRLDAVIADPDSPAPEPGRIGDLSARVNRTLCPTDLLALPASELSGRPDRRRPASAVETVPLPDPSYTTGRSAATSWLDARWHAPGEFATWCRTQLENYMLVLPVGAAPLPTEGRIHVSVWHDALYLDCQAEVQAAGRAQVAYRLHLDALQVERLRRWRVGWEKRSLTG